MNKIINSILRILYPEKCPVCGTIITANDSKFCDSCIDKLKIISEPVCVICGRPVSGRKIRCHECSSYKHSFVGGRITFSYEQVASAIYRFKYMNRPEYAEAFGKVMAENNAEWIKAINPDALIPVPLHKKRLIKRGYNQAEELAKVISKYSQIPVECSLVKRIKNTSPLKYNDRAGRRNSMDRAFIVSENVVKLNTVVLIDDIFTTGSTLDAVSECLKAQGITDIYFLTISAAGT